MSSSGMARRSRSRRNKQLQQKDAYSERELAKRPEVTVINRYMLIHAYMLKALKLVVSLALLWSTVVLLGGFVSSLKSKDFWYLTVIAFMQAAGLLNMLGDYQFLRFLKWTISSYKSRMIGAVVYKRFVYAVAYMIFASVCSLAAYAPLYCLALAQSRLWQQDYGTEDGEESKSNLKPALNLFYSLTVAQGAIFLSVLIIGNGFGAYLSVFIRHHGFSRKVIVGYYAETRLRYMNNQASSKSWNLIIYGEELLDSELHDDFVLGARALNMVIEQGKHIRFLVRSPRCRIQKLLRSLGWRSLEDRETRGLAAGIVAHLAYDLDLSEFPGSLEIISSFLESSVRFCQRSDQEVLSIPSKTKNGNMTDGRKQESKHNKPNDSGKGTNEDLLLQGLRILENLAHNKHNCTEIYKNSDLLSTITAPFNKDKNKFIEDLTISDAWIKAVDASLRVVIQLMEAPGDTGTSMRCLIAGNSKATENLQAVLGLEVDSSILELQTHCIEALAQLFADESTCVSQESRANFIKRALHVFLTDEWMEDYFQDIRKKMEEEIKQEITNQLVKEDENPTFWEERWPCLVERKNKKRRKVLENKLEKEKMKEAQEAASEHKEAAGEALAMLCMGSLINTGIIMSFTGCTDVVHSLTVMLDSKIETVECRVSSTEIVKVGISTGCRINAACILKNLCAHSMMPDGSVKKTLLEKVLQELLNINRDTESHSQDRSSRNSCAATRNFLFFWEKTATRNDVENPPPQGSDQHESLDQPEERILQAALLSLFSTIRATWTDVEDFASCVVQLVARKDFVGRLKAAVEENNYATLACLAMLKVTCEIVILLIQSDHFLEEIKEKQIIDALSDAASTTSGLESCMLFAGRDYDCHGVPVRPLSRALVKQAQDLLQEKEAGLPNHNPDGGRP